MPAIGLRTRTLLGLPLLAAALAASPPSAQARDRITRMGEDGRVVRVVPFADLTDEELVSRAVAAGPLRIRAGEHVSGRIFAQGIRFEGEGPVTVEPGTEIFSHGDIVVDAPIVGRRTTSVFQLKKGGPGAPVGANGAAGQGLVLTCDQSGNVIVNQPIQLADGEPGGDVTVDGPSGQGGNGGEGGSVHIVCPNKVTISANVAPGRGGRGGFAHVTGRDGGADQDGETVKSACGGKGGVSGTVEVRAREIEFTTDVDGKAEGKIALRAGGEGGEAIARGGAGGAPTLCDKHAGDGGAATARGGAAGIGSMAVVESKVLLPEHFVAKDFSGYDEAESSDGGDAYAYGGKGHDGMTCLATGCPDKGRTAAAAGDGGSAFAFGGLGATAGKIGGGRGVLNKRAQAGAEMPPGEGGRAVSRGGVGGIAGNGEDAKNPGNGGRGGRGGLARATGGGGGSSTLGQKKGVPLADNQGPLKGGNGGVADALGGDSGNSGNGGDCCENPAHSGGLGGIFVRGGKGFAIGGNGGRGHVRGDRGGTIVGDGVDGIKGVDGEACPAYVTDDVDLVSSLQPNAIQKVPFPLHMTFRNRGTVGVPLHVEICCDGRKIGEFDIVVPAAVGEILGTISPSFSLTIGGRHMGHRISIMVRLSDTAPSETVKNHRVNVY
jgi:hypothetical protein